MSSPIQKIDKRRHNVQGEKTRQTILRIAGRLFAQKGYDGVSIRCISDEMDAMPSLIMHHFGTKSNLYKKTIEHHVIEAGQFSSSMAPLTQVDATNKQAAANAIAETVHTVFDACHGPYRVKNLTNLLLQILTVTGATPIKQAQEWLAPAEDAFKTFLKKVCPSLSETEVGIRMQIFWGDLFYPATARSVLLQAHGWKEYPSDWLNLWKKMIASDTCMALGLPTPTFDYPEIPDKKKKVD
ncbi:MAG: TetR/AcrR family transcriptional regulator [Puniceicoccales bacterium]|jgi:AcrR family transcriptional regulator|nr:TetR/AcrR family transcriptional regulator [Puniceicoccales bacterium]